jgi:hypothetical protein
LCVSVCVCVSQRFHHKTALQQHEKLHRREEGKIVTCQHPGCFKTFADESELRKHNMLYAPDFVAENGFLRNAVGLLIKELKGHDSGSELIKETEDAMANLLPLEMQAPGGYGQGMGMGMGMGMGDWMHHGHMGGGWGMMGMHAPQHVPPPPPASLVGALPVPMSLDGMGMGMDGAAVGDSNGGRASGNGDDGAMSIGGGGGMVRIGGLHVHEFDPVFSPTGSGHVMRGMPQSAMASLMDNTPMQLLSPKESDLHSLFPAGEDFICEWPHL